MLIPLFKKSLPPVLQKKLKPLNMAFFDQIL